MTSDYREPFNPTQISDFFGEYPDVDDPLFNTYIAKKQEFSGERPTINEATPVRGQGYIHQKFAVKFQTWYDRLLLLADPGVGKSISMIHAAELFKSEYLKNPDDPTKIRRAIILVRGDPLIENIRNEIVCKATLPGTYDTDFVLRAENETTMTGNLTRELKTWYDIMTYGQFAKIINQFEREEDLENYMSNIAIYVDEAHNVPTNEDITGAFRPIHETIEEVEEDQQKESYYNTIHRAFHKGKRNKIVLATATPMNNLGIDIIPLMNLILPLNKQMQRWKKEQDEQFTDQPLEYFEPYFRGRVSYVRALDTGARHKPQGQVVPGYHTIICPCDMSIFQYNVYLKASTTGVGETKEKFYGRTRQVSNFVFPDESYGGEGFDRYVELVKGRYQFKNTVEGQTCRQHVRENLDILSAKYAKIVEICSEKWPGESEVVIDDKKGVIFVYFADYVMGSGAILLGLCLREHGYQEFNETTSIFSKAQNSEYTGSRSLNPCPSTSNNQGKRIARIGMAKRYAILSSKTPKSHIKPLFNALNSYENRYGQYVQVLIGSITAREGINVNNGVAMILASSSWTASSNKQAEDRVFRSTSHVLRIAEKRQRLLSQGLPADNVTFDVETYNLAAIYESLPADDVNLDAETAALYQEDPRFRISNINTIDPKMYIESEQKDKNISKIMRKLKQSSVDCYINKGRNIRPTDVAGSPACDFMECNYTCTGIQEDKIFPIDRTTKVLYYSEEEIEDASEAVKRLFSRFYQLKIEQIHRLLNTKDPIYIDMAIERLISNNVKVHNRMGYFGYLRENQSGVIYLEKDPFEIKAHPENTVYSSVLIGTQDPRNNSFNDYITNLDVATERPIIMNLYNTDPNDPSFQTILESLSIISKVTLLEHALYDRKSTGETDGGGFYNAIISAFNHAIFQVPEPVDLLQKTAKQIANRGKSRGRKPNPNVQPKLKQLGFTEDFLFPQFDPNIVSDKVILHTLLNQGSHDRTSYGVTTRFFKAEGQLRILKMSEGTGWRDVNQYEDLVYNNLIKRSINDIRLYYEQRYSIYGIMLLPENKLHIRDRENENIIASRDDARNVRDGRVCNTWLKPDLVDILYRLDLTLQNNNMAPNIPRQVMIDYLRNKSSELLAYNLDTFPDKKLISYYQWYQSNSSREEICGYIKEYFKRSDRLFTGKTPITSSLSPNGATLNVGSIYAPQSTLSDYSLQNITPSYNLQSINAQDITPSYVPQSINAPSYTLQSINAQNISPSYVSQSITPSINAPSYTLQSITPSYVPQSVNPQSINAQNITPSYVPQSVTPSINAPSYTLQSINAQNISPNYTLQSINPQSISAQNISPSYVPQSISAQSISPSYTGMLSQLG